MLSLRNRFVRLFLLLLPVLIILAEIHRHVRSFDIIPPIGNADEPFATKEQCPVQGEPVSTKQNAVIFMLARNSEVGDAVKAIRTFEQHFNHRYHYPYVFANNEPFSAEFKEALGREVSANAQFETIPSHMWGFPNHTTPEQQEQARLSMAKMEQANIIHAGNVDYHNMCRFQSGFFYDLPAMQPFDWYWRIEPDSRYTCDIMNDPFDEMSKYKKVYGYAIALWEVGRTAPSLFRTVDDYRSSQKLGTTNLFTSMLEASWAPFLVREWLMSHFPSRNKYGDGWNYCHFWSNFEIVNLGFYRSEQYRDFFAHLDSTGGFHMERWGDAAVHSLATGLFLNAADVHYFEDIGYRHGGLQHCPRDTVGCDCDCDPTQDSVDDFCLNKLRETVAGVD